MVKFIADSACDLKELPGVCFETVPLTLTAGPRNFVDDKELDLQDMLNYFSHHHGRSTTACPSMQAWIDSFEGADEIYVVTITSGLSGTYNSAMAARDHYLADHPGAKIYVVDSLSTGPGEMLLLEKLAELKNEGKSFEEISTGIEEYKSTLRLYFGLASLHNLAQNGRVNKLAASAIGIMNIRILGTASKEGTIESVAKCRGEKRLIETTIAEILKAGYKGGKVRMSHVENGGLADAISARLRQEFPKADIRICPTRGLCSFYAERNGIIIGCECPKN